MAMSALQSGWREKGRKCCPRDKKIEWKIHSPCWDLREICIIPSITSIKIYRPPSCVQLCISQVYLNLGGKIYPVRNDKSGCCIYGLLGWSVLINRRAKKSTESLGIAAAGISHEQRPPHILICAPQCNNHTNALASLHLWKKKKSVF